MALTRWLDRLFSRGRNRSQVGNVVFWVAFCFLGQPVCLLLYYYDFVVANGKGGGGAGADDGVWAWLASAIGS